MTTPNDAPVRLDDRLANEAMRIADGLEPREHCATLLCDAVEALRAQDRALAKARERVNGLYDVHGDFCAECDRARAWLAATAQEES